MRNSRPRTRNARHQPLLLTEAFAVSAARRDAGEAIDDETESSPPADHHSDDVPLPAASTRLMP